MSVLVKGMGMPECCAYCSFAYDCFLCTATGNEFIYRSEEEGGYIDFTETRMPDCPLIEIPPHSDLIDINALKLAIVNVDYVNKHDYLKGVLNAINNAQIVIPADKDGET